VFVLLTHTHIPFLVFFCIFLCVCVCVCVCVCMRVCVRTFVSKSSTKCNATSGKPFLCRYDIMDWPTSLRCFIIRKTCVYVMCECVCVYGGVCVCVGAYVCGRGDAWVVRGSARLVNYLL